MKLFALALRISAALAVPSAVMANVIVVAPTGGDYAEIQPAVDAASDGDTILIKSGSYSTFTVVDKGLSIVADAGSSVRVNGGIRVRSLGAGKTLVLESLRGYGSSYAGALGGLVLSRNQGHVRVEACAFFGAGWLGEGYEAIHVDACDHVSLTRTTSLGGSGAQSSNCCWHLSGAGLKLSNSSVSIYDCTLQGGTGQSGSNGHNGAYGGSGCSAFYTSTVFASGTSFIGGNGGNAGFGIPLGDAYGGNGGDGIDLLFNSSAQLLDDFTLHGLGGQSGGGSASYPGSNGVDRYVFGGSTIVDLAGTSKHLIAPSPVRENTVASLSFKGQPGETVTLLIARTPGFAFEVLEKGMLLLGDPIRAIDLGIVPAGGTLGVQLPIPAIGPELESSLLHLQARFTDGQGNAVLGGPSSMVILNQAF